MRSLNGTPWKAGHDVRLGLAGQIMGPGDLLVLSGTWWVELVMLVLCLVARGRLGYETKRGTCKKSLSDGNSFRSSVVGWREDAGFL